MAAHRIMIDQKMKSPLGQGPDFQCPHRLEEKDEEED